MSVQNYTEYMPYRFITNAGIQLPNGDPAQDLASFDDELIAGTYEIKISLVADYQAANDKLHFQLFGAFPSPEIVKESKDNAEVLAFSYAFPVSWPGGQMQIDLRAFSVGGDVFIEAANLMIQRVA